MNPKRSMSSSSSSLLFGTLALSLLLGWCACAEPTSDKQALLDFINNIQYIRARLKWDLSTPACNWTGVVCDPTLTHVYELRLPGVGLVGPIPFNTVGRLASLRVLSLRSNLLSGPLPADFGNLTSLRSLYLQNNGIEGGFPESLTRLPGLSRIDVSNNRFEGEIPASIGGMPLQTLFLQGNRFIGGIPVILNTSGLVGFDVSNNNLAGQIPKTLAKFPESSFSGNPLLCGAPLPPCQASSPSRPAKRRHTGLIIGIVIAAIVGAVLLLLFCFRKRSHRSGTIPQPPPKQHSAQSTAAEIEAGESSSREEVVLQGDDTMHKLVFLDGDKDGLFSLEDLLQASAEVLGKGTTGSSYKADLEDGMIVVVKRLKDVAAGRKEFESQMTLLGRLRHDNLVGLIACYYSKDEKLIISDYIPAGSLASLLHGRRATGKAPLDWVTRFRVGLTTAKGLHYLHTVAKIPHGNVKSSNILITNSLEASICDYGMNSLFGPSTMPNRMTGYRAPEVQREAKMVSFKSDVYSFGVVLLELLTGKAPIQVASLGDDGIDLPRWVQSVMSEAFDGEIYDVEVAGTGAEEKMIGVLHVAMRCVEVVPDRRPEMGEVIRMLEMVERGEFQPSPSGFSRE